MPLNLGDGSTPTKARKPAGTAAQDRGHNGDGFDIVHRGWAAIKPRTRRKRRLHARHAFFALEAFQQRGFLAADIGPCPMMQIQIKIPAGPFVKTFPMNVMSIQSLECSFFTKTNNPMVSTNEDFKKPFELDFLAT